MGFFVASPFAPVAAQVPAEVTGLQWCASGPKQCLQWTAVAGALKYRVYRGELVSEPCVINPALDSCRQGNYTVTTTGLTIPENPVAGRFYWFLATAENGVGEGSPGLASAGTRQANDTGGCLPSCGPSGAACAGDNDCCSANCMSGVCVAGCCQSNGAFCNNNQDCCSGTCSGNVCQAPCTPNGGMCATNTQCCSGLCTGGQCQAACAPNGATCTAAGDCCSGVCTGGVCQAACTPGGGVCATNGQCCSGLCLGGICQAACTPTGGACLTTAECCIGTCTGGVCVAPCSPNGLACAADADCCSTYCSLAHVCANAPCNPGYFDCNADPTDGCEVYVLNDPNNCGGCNAVCLIPNAVNACVNGSCVFLSCNAGFGDCNLQAADGCETNILSNPSHCGGCNQPCGIAAPNCINGSCH